MKKMPLFLIFTFLSTSFLSCASTNNALLKEEIEIEANSLKQDFVGITSTEISTATKGTDYRGSSQINQFDIFKSEGSSWIRHEENPGRYTNGSIDYYVDDFKITYYPSSHNAYYSFGELFNSNEYSLTKNTNELIKNNDIFVKKNIDGDFTYYLINVHNYDKLFHSLTNNEFLSLSDNGDLELPKTLEITSCVKDGLIFYQESSITFTMKKTTMYYSLRLDFVYQGDSQIPELVKQEVEKGKTDKKLNNFEISHIEAIDKTHRGETPPLDTSIEENNTDKLHYFKFDIDYGFLNHQYDGTKYFVFHDDYSNNDQLIVYDANSLEELYRVKFKRKIFSFSCQNGKIFVSLELKSNTKTPSGIYSLDDFSFISVYHYKQSLIYENKMYYTILDEEKHSVMVMDLNSMESKLLYSYITKDIPAGYLGRVDYRFHLDAINGIFFLYYHGFYGEGLVYIAYDISTDAKLYDGTTNEVSGSFNKEKWLDDGLTFEDCEKMIDIKTGQIIDCANQESSQYVYILPNEYVDYSVRTVSNKHRKYDVIALYKIERTDEHTVNTVDWQYWLYNKESDQLFIQISYLPSSHYFINDSYYIGINNTQLVLIEL